MPGEAQVNIGSSQWGVWLATTPAERYAGLANISSIPAGTGMFFDEGRSWLIDVVFNEMLFPLDVAFISSSFDVSGVYAEFVVTDVYRGVAAGSLDVINPSTPCRYFLEVNAGEMADVNVGDLVEVIVIEGEFVGEKSATNMMIGMMVVLMMMGMMMRMMRNPMSQEVKKKYLPSTSPDTKWKIMSMSEPPVPWLSEAWRETVEYANSKDIDLEGALESTLEEEEIGEEEAHGYKVSLSGYYLVAAGKATDRVVDDTFDLLYRSLIDLKEHSIKTRGLNIDTLEGYDKITEELERKWWYTLGSIFADAKRATTRLDKVLVIDAIMHEYHVDTTLLDELVGLFMTDIAQAAHELIVALGET